jgi:transcriptional regulator with XRE-family HTH domain
VTERLKQARESRGLSHRQMAGVTKVSTRVIAALEEGRIERVPPGVYRRSLVRLVAGEVGLEPEATLRLFLTEYPDDLPQPGAAAVAEAPPPRRGSAGLRRVLTMLGAVVPLLVGIAYFTRPPAAPGHNPEPRTPPVVHDAGDWRPEIVPAGGFSEAPPPAVRPVSMLITISEPCQVQVLADGGLVVGRAFVAGESFRVAFSDSIELYGDNAGAVQYSLNGQAGRLLGGPGEVLSARIGRDDYPFFLSAR